MEELSITAFQCQNVDKPTLQTCVLFPYIRNKIQVKQVLCFSHSYKDSIDWQPTEPHFSKLLEAVCLQLVNNDLSCNASIYITRKPDFSNK